MKLLIRVAYLTTVLLSFYLGSVIVAVEGTSKWQGILTTPGGALDIIIELNDAKQSGTISVPAQSLHNMKLDVVTINKSDFTFEVKPLGIIYRGKIDDDNITGIFKQGPVFEAELNFAKQSKEQQKAIADALSRPQTPKGPFPYLEEEVSISNGDVTLSGTITKPKGNGPFPAAIMITGSGPQDRDETILGHKPFKVIADHLSRRGLLVLRFDDRGFAKSTGIFKGATIQDFASDVEAVFQFLKTRDDVNPKMIGLIGHSEVGAVGPLMATNNDDVAFIVSLAGVGTSPKQLYATQQRDILLMNGAQGGDLIFNTFMEAIEKVVSGAKSEEVSMLLKTKLRYPDDAADMVGRFMTDPWFISLMNYDNAATISSLKMPVLAINGEKDIQVEPKANLGDFHKYLTAAGNKDFTITEIAGLNHLFQPSETGNVNEYGNLPVTFDEATLKMVGDWIIKRVQ